MFANWDAIKNRYQAIEQQLIDPALEQSKRHTLQKEHAHLSTLLAKHRRIEELEQQLAQTKQQAASNSDKEMAELYEYELADLKDKLEREQRELEFMVVPPSEHETRSVYLEIRAGTGGQEAALFAGDLLRMYSNYALKKGWKATVESASPTDLGGYREVVLHIDGKGAYGHLKYESGVHRVQRVPATETAGRVHTSTATIAVLPEAEEVDVTINPADLRIDVYRSSGAGGQHVNTTDSAVRITHIPTGVVVSCQDERSQHKNKAKAMKILQSRLLAAKVEAYEAEMSRKRKEQVGAAMRSEKVRTYNFPQNRVTDHQADVTLKKLDYVMEGDLDEIIQALRDHELEDRKKAFLAKFV